ncbi:hypothetical protein [Streptomyces zingiberis]|uniref:Uncharacterized protein n=1 Tax=Streptomyces zingiberis TaxID=2053010 RepID=A0ABX1BXP7_9ACTN|nr:hypothetical protein [Streptomyces zingiberis]NJQ02462.1 hypothetical protein [Streptomyces zingiberis]
MAPGSEVVHGYPHLETVRSAVTALHRSLPAGELRSFTASVLPVEVAFSDDEDLRAGVARVAGVMVRHLRLPEAPVAVTFREMAEAATVDPAGGREYDIELHPRYDRHRRDIGAVLAHEFTHVFLHRAGLSFAGTERNEILTDTAAAYLGAGWLLLDAFRRSALESQKLGYLTPEEYGYVLAKRALLFGEDPSPWFTSPQAYPAYTRGLALARRDGRRPPLAAAGPAARLRYARDRRAARAGVRRPRPAERSAPGGGAGGQVDGGRTGGADRRAEGADGAGYTFEPGPPLRVSFPCPVCHQRLRVPVRGRVRARCGVCGTVLECDT